MESINKQTLNPWVSMWLKPKATIQQIVDTNPERSVLVLVAIIGVSEALNNAIRRNMGDTRGLPMIFLIAATLGPVVGVIGLYLSSWLVSVSGHWIGGQASSRSIRAAIAWSNVPMIWAAALWIPELALYSQVLFTTEATFSSNSLAYFFLGCRAIELTAVMWTFVLLGKCIGHLQGFSFLKTFLNVFLSGFLGVLVITLPFFIIVAIIVLLL